MPRRTWMYKSGGTSIPAGASLSRLAQATLSTAARSHLVPALRDDGQESKCRDVHGCTKAAVPASLPANERGAAGTAPQLHRARDAQTSQ
jgi:hypothetical protein